MSQEGPRTEGRLFGLKPLCPVCGRELRAEQLREGLWHCLCGEEVPASLAVDPFRGCPHGPQCNCGRRRGL
jgi:ribosomal protein L37AE/L43A